ncbi:MAG TPA: hypothetical protein VFX21_09045 [Acidimicrobiia bacterium]|nr:hypothetical protein [Acidimicrobiia bacterium]
MSASATIKNKLKTWQAGAGVMALGAVLLGAGLLVTTSAAPPADCPEGSTLVSKYKANNGTYTFEKPAGNDNIVTLSNTTAASGDWSSTVPIVYMIVKAGPDSITTSFSPAQTSGSWDNLGFLVGSGQHPNISDVLFCESTTPATTTSTVTSSTTTTQAPTSTTTTAATTTSTAAPTTTSTLPSVTTSTGAATTTTTVAPTTTATAAPVTTTTVPIVVEGTTTTVAAATSTTGPAGSTTTVANAVVTTTTTDPSQTGSNSAVVTTTSIGHSDTSSESLPRTGGQSTPLVVTGLIFLVAGLAMTLLALNRRRTA